MNHHFEDEETLTLKEAQALILKELNERLPKTNKDGFLPAPIIYEAIKRVENSINEK